MTDYLSLFGVGGAVLVATIFIIFGRREDMSEHKKDIFQRLSKLEQETASLKTHISLVQQSLIRIENKLDALTPIAPNPYTIRGKQE